MYYQSVGAQTLESAACEFIEEFDKENETTFVENFLFMTHNREVCDSGTNCQGPISKRTLPVSITMGTHLPSDPNINEIAGISLGSLQIWLSAISGLSVELVSRHSTPQMGAGFIRVEIFDEDNSRAILDQKKFQSRDLLERFLISPKLECIGFNGDWENGGLEYSEVWIKADQSYEQISECLTEEVYGTFGVRSDPIGLASLYSDKRWLQEQPDTEVATLLSMRDVWIMRLLYNDLIENGDDKATSVSKIDQIISRDCG